MSEQSYKFRVPGEATALRTLLARAWPYVTRRQITAALRSRKIRVGRRTVQDAGKLLSPGSLVRVDSVPGGEATNDDSVPQSVPDGQTPFVVLTPLAPWPSGSLNPNKHLDFTFETLVKHGGLNALKIELVKGSVADALEHLASLKMAVLGDAFNEGILVAGGLRIRGFDEPEADEFWPAERVFRRSAHSKKKKGTDAAVLSVSQGSISAIKKGHQWVLSDKETGDPRQFQAGTLVRLEGPREGPEITARISGSEPLVARVWKNPPSGPQFNETLEGRVADAFARRKRLHDDPRTTAYRVIHGEADGLPGLAVDRLGPVLRLLYSSRCLDPLHDRIIASLRAEGSRVLGSPPILLQVVQLRNRPQGNLECVRLIEGDFPEEEHRPGFFRVKEAGLSYWVEPGLNEIHRPRPGFGLFVDQRINRERVCKDAAGKAWLNLFCHTGAFSVALLHAGASKVVSVDLSRPYLHWLEDNLELNGLKSDKHQNIKQDARRYLERLGPADNFDGIILDPPTAASSGRRFWSVKKEVGQLISLCLKKLNPGGELLVTRNDRRAQGKLEAIIEDIAKAERIRLDYVKSAPPGPDFPRMQGFPEGDSFQGVLAKRA